MSEENPESWPDDRDKSRDERTFDEFFKHYSPQVYSLALKMLGDKEAAKDIVNTVFEKILRAGYKIDMVGKPLFNKVTKNECIDYARKRTHTENSPAIENSQSADSEVEKELDYEMVVVLVITKAEELLPEQCGITFKLRFSGKSYTEISEILGISKSTARSHIKNAIQRLKEALPKLDIDHIFPDN